MHVTFSLDVVLAVFCGLTNRFFFISQFWWIAKPYQNSTLGMIYSALIHTCTFSSMYKTCCMNLRTGNVRGHIAPVIIAIFWCHPCKKFAQRVMQFCHDVGTGSVIATHKDSNTISTKIFI